MNDAVDQFRTNPSGGAIFLAQRRKVRARFAGTMFRALGSAGLAALLAMPVFAQNGQVDLTNESIVDLMNIEVTSASKKEQKLFRTASAIFVITAEDIRRSGATNIPDLLRMVPGLDVAQINGSTWAISARGFNSQFSNKLLVMIDGRVVYTSTFAGVFWDTMDLPLEDIDRIEVIRGPGGAVWGANAVNGVISIFTKKASETKGGLAIAEGGNVQQGAGMLQYGGSLAKGTDYRAYLKYFNQTQMFDPSGENGADGWHAMRGGFRVDSSLSPKNSLMFEGDLSSGREGEYGFVLPSVTSPGLVPVAEQIDIADGSFVGLWNHTFSETSSTALQVSIDRHLRDDPQNPEARDTFDVQFQHHLAAGQRHDIVWGLGYRYTPDRITGGLTVTMDPTSRHLQVFSSFFQDEIALIPDRLYLTAGTKVEHNDYTGFEFMPDVRLAWLAGTREMLWTAVSRDLRAPSRNDTNLVLNLGTGPAGPPYLMRILGNPDFRDERLLAYEAGYRTMISGHLSLDLSAYINDYDNLETTEPGTPFDEPTPLPPHIVLPFTYENLMEGETDGVELAAVWSVARRWTLSPGYALEHVNMRSAPTSQDRQTPEFVEGSSPRNSAQLRSHVDFGKGWTWEDSAYLVGRLNNQGPLSNITIPAYTRVDTGLTWNLREGVSLSFVGQNLAKDRHFEFDDINGALQNGQIRRSAYVEWKWQF
jgi:iron complex outermembrane recepter protein